MPVVPYSNFIYFIGIFNFWPCCTTFLLFLKASSDRAWKVTPMIKIWHWNNDVFMPNAGKYNEKWLILLLFRAFDPVAQLFCYFWKRHQIELEKLPLWSKSHIETNLTSCKTRGIKTRILKKGSISAPESMFFSERLNFFGVKSSDSWRAQNSGLDKVLFIKC